MADKALKAMQERLKKNALSYEALANALFENYESLYDIDAQTSAYVCYHESDSYRDLKIKSCGEDFFGSLAAYVPRIIYPDDQEYVMRMLDRDAILAGLEREKYYSFVYRLLSDGEPVYHQVRAIKSVVDGRLHILLGVSNIDAAVRTEKEHTDELASMLQKERTHMQAILASAAGYIEINLTKDMVLEKSPDFPTFHRTYKLPNLFWENNLSYTSLYTWLCTNVVSDEVEKCKSMCSRDYLLDCFANGDKRSSVSYSVSMTNGVPQPCRQVFYLYQDNASGDILCFSVLYDLTEQQKKAKELKELEEQLRMSRIRNFTSQMQPHFLYNALGSIQEIVLDDPVYASELIGDFTTHLRSCIRAMANDDALPFDQELDNIRAYVNIEKMRFGDKLRVNYEVGTTDFLIIPLSIQPLVENAIRHGVYKRGMRGGTVTIRSTENEDSWIVQVEDDGVGFDYDRLQQEMNTGKRDSTGLKNLIFRLDKVMNAHVDIKSAIGVGTTVTVTIPKGGTLE